VALFDALGVATEPTDMSFAVSLDNGALEYGGSTLRSLFAQKRNLFRPRFWSMLRDLRRFYRDAPAALSSTDTAASSLGDFLVAQRFGAAFRDDHLLPMAAAIWSAPMATMLDYPAAAFIRFHENHGLLKIAGRPIWRTVKGGSRNYVERLARSFAGEIRLNTAVASIKRDANGVTIMDHNLQISRFDHVVIATHANQALAMLTDPSPQERRLLSAFNYSRNVAVLHADERLMPRRRAVWSSWNYVSAGQASEGGAPTITYWMNNLQRLGTERPLFVTLNPESEPDPSTVFKSEMYEHPIFDGSAMAAQRELWSLQGGNRTWFCGSYFGAGFHEDGLQAGLAVAEQLGAVRRPWRVAEESGRICVAAPFTPRKAA
jgi:predicted NAD/FAD-binding protein